MNKNIVKSKLYNTGFITEEMDELRIKQGLESQSISNYCNFTKKVSMPPQYKYGSELYQSNKEKLSDSISIQPKI